MREFIKAVCTVVALVAFVLVGMLMMSQWSTSARTGLTTMSVAHAQLGSTWTEHHAPAANNAATISRAAVTTGVHVLDCAVAKLAAGAAAPTAATVNLVVRDGATGAGTVKLQMPMSIPAVAGDPGQTFSQCGLNIVGTVNTAMTIEFSAAGGANTIESVFMKGFTNR